MDEDAVVEWLLEGDPAIRWQVMRDLLDAPRDEWEAERARTVETGWAAELLGHQGRDGEWPAGRWTASVWTLRLLVACGVPEGHPSAYAPLERLLGRFMPAGEKTDPAFMLRRVDLCHLGFWLGLGAYFLPGDPRLRPLAEAVLSAQFEDGGCNCRMRKHPDRMHSSFNTTFNVLENLRIAASHGEVAEPAFLERRRARPSSCSPIGCTARTRPARSSPSASRTSRTGGTGTTRCCAASTTYA